MFAPWKKSYDHLDSVLKSRDITLPEKVCIVKAMVFPVVIYRCESWTMKDGWELKNWSFWTVVLEETLESPLDGKETKPVNPKWNQPWIFIGRTDAEADAPILWPPDAKNRLFGKDPDGKNWRQEEKGTIEDEMVGWNHPLNGYEFEQALGDDEGHGSLACCKSQDWKVLDTTWQLNNNNWHIATVKVLGVQDNDLTYIHFMWLP